jgi:tungstate transport system substrate-binding protein
MLVDRVASLLLVIILCVPGAVRAQERFITVGSTMAPKYSGLFDRLLPTFTEKTGIAVRVLPVGTGIALDLGRQGDVDLVLGHDRAAEEKFIAEGHGIARFDVMRDEFVLVGPKSDPANVRALTDVLEGFRRIAATKATFVSRRDRSGTNAAELRFWKAAGTDIGWIKGWWYKEIRQGGPRAIDAAIEQDAYTLLDRSTWAAIKDKRNLVVHVEGDKLLNNEYAGVLVNPQKHKNAKTVEARAFLEWLISSGGQEVIADYKVDGEQLFIPTAVLGGYVLRGPQG